MSKDPFSKKAGEFDNPEDFFVHCLRKSKQSGDPKLLFRDQGLTKLPLGIAVTSQLGSLSNLYKISVNGNNLTYLPAQLFNPQLLPVLREIEANNNSIVSIPTQVGQLRSLRTLSLNHNSISHVPLTIGRLSKLDALYLDANPLIAPFSSLVGCHQLAIVLWCAQMLNYFRDIDNDTFDSGLSAIHGTMTEPERDKILAFINNSGKSSKAMDSFRSKVQLSFFMNPIPEEDEDLGDLVFTTGISSAATSLKRNKYLDDFISSFSNPLAQGWFTKIGNRVRSWKRRWFVLKNGTLKYYRSPDDETYKGIIQISNIVKIYEKSGKNKSAKSNMWNMETRGGRIYSVKCTEMARKANDDSLKEFFTDLELATQYAKKASQAVGQILSTPHEDALKQFRAFFTDVSYTPATSVVNHGTRTTITIASTGTTNSTSTTTSALHPKS